jgi:hypothetical protein
MQYSPNACVAPTSALLLPFQSASECNSRIPEISGNAAGDRPKSEADQVLGGRFCTIRENFDFEAALFGKARTAGTETGA